jgi:hypothetical protein
MEESKKWDEAESIQLIRSMIETTRYQVYSDRYIYFMWGYATLICAGLHYLLAYHIGYAYPYMVWLVMPILSIVHFVSIGKRKKSTSVSTFTGRVMQGIWGGMFIGIVALVIASFQVGWQATYPVFMLFYGMASYATGKALQYKYLIWGGIASILFGIVAFFQPFQYQLLLLMLAILVSYILPAHLMQKS